MVIAGLNADAGPLYGEIGAVMVMLPNVVMTLTRQRYLVLGLSLGALKGVARGPAFPSCVGEPAKRWAAGQRRPHP